MVDRDVVTVEVLAHTVRVKRGPGGSAGSVDVGAMFDPDDSHDALVRDDPVHDPVGAAARRVVAGELPTEWSADPLGIVE